MARTLVRRFIKVIFYLILMVVIGRTLGPSEIWLDRAWALRLGIALYGPGEVGADNFYDLYFYIDVLSNLIITTPIYLITMKLISRVRSR